MYFNFVFMMGLGFYTICKFWRSANVDIRRNMSVLWVMLVAYTLSNLAIATATISAALDAGEQSVFIVHIADKTVAMFLAGMVWFRLRSKEAMAVPRVPGRNANPSSTPKENTGPRPSVA